MSEWVLQWYAFLSTLNAIVADPLREAADGVSWAPFSALAFGLIGATAPCQLSTNLAALAYVARADQNRGGAASTALAYLLGKVVVYTVIGTAVILAGRQLALGAIPLVVVARKALGPTMVALGLYFLGALPLRFAFGGAISDWIEARSGTGTRGAFLLGTAFSFAFCPTLFLLFFGLTIPLALASPVGVVFPGLFAVGTAVPLLALAGLATLGDAAGAYRRWLQRGGRWVRPAAAVVLLVAGLHDTLVYWFL